MNQYYPKPKEVSLAAGVKTLEYSSGDTIILVSQMMPGSKIESHAHSEAQIGFCISGSFEIEIEGENASISNDGIAYYAEPHAMHSAFNPHNEIATTIDVKRHVPQGYAIKGTSRFFERKDERILTSGLPVSFHVGPWFEIMFSKVPTTAVMPSHKHKSEQFGICLRNKYNMEINGVETVFSAGDVYFAPSKIPHSAHNPFQADADSINIFIPPRYHKALKNKTSIN